MGFNLGFKGLNYFSRCSSVPATEINALRRSYRISKKERIRNVTIRQQIGLEEKL